MSLLLGIDLGGTKTEGVVLRPNGSEIGRKRVETVRGDYTATMDTILDLVSTLEKQAGIRFDRIGIGIPGSISAKTGLVRNANSTWINGKPLVDDLARVLGRKVRVSNDANCLALSEARDGAAQGAHSVFAVILGTGVGGGLVVNGSIVAGANGLAGEWGHTPLAHQGPDGPLCFCGRQGCMEQYVSGPAILNDYTHSGGEVLDRVETLVERAKAGEVDAIATLRRHLERLAHGLGGIVNLLDPDVFVLGGGVSNLPGLAESLPRAIAPHVFAPARDKVEIQVRRARWGDSSGVRGAARLWEHE